MIVVSDTSPVSYLVLIQEAQLLEALFREVLIPVAVAGELRHPRSPAPLGAFMAAPPPWLRVHERGPAGARPKLAALDEGEREALELALELGADLVLLDDRAAREAARGLGLRVTGVLGVLDAAARRGLVDLPRAVSRLKATSFRVAPGLLVELLERHR